MFPVSVFKNMFEICCEFKIVQELFTFFLHFWLPYFLSNCLQKARRCLRQSIFSQFLGEDTNKPFYELAPAAFDNLVPTVRRRTPQYEILATGL